MLSVLTDDAKHFKGVPFSMVQNLMTFEMLASGGQTCIADH